MFSWEYRKGPVTWIRLTAGFSNKTVTAVRFCFFIYPLQKRLVVRLLSKHICLQPFPPKIHFFTVFLVHCLHEVSPGDSDCRSIACTLFINMIFFSEFQLEIPAFCHVCLHLFCLQWQQFLSEFYSFMGSFEEKLTREMHTYCLYACL